MFIYVYKYIVHYIFHSCEQCVQNKTLNKNVIYHIPFKRNTQSVITFSQQKFTDSVYALLSTLTFHVEDFCFFFVLYLFLVCTDTLFEIVAFGNMLKRGLVLSTINLGFSLGTYLLLWYYILILGGSRFCNNRVLLFPVFLLLLVMKVCYLGYCIDHFDRTIYKIFVESNVFSFCSLFLLIFTHFFNLITFYSSIALYALFLFLLLD